MKNQQSLKQYEVVLFNDSTHSFDQVLVLLALVLRKNPSELVETVQYVHDLGQWIITQCHFELAETICNELKQCGLKVKLVPVKERG